MKRLISCLFIILFTVSFISCTEEEKMKEGFYMTATVRNVTDRIEVDVIESEYADGIYWVIVGSDTVIYDTDSKIKEMSDIKVGDTVRILYSGQVMMSYPPQIVALEICII